MKEPVLRRNGTGRPPGDTSPCSRWAERPTLVVWLCVCLALSGLSLAGQHGLNYDAFSWLVRAREIVHGGLDTGHGAAWKPLPVILDLPLVLTGAPAAPALWLLVARTGSLMAIVMLFRLGARVAGAAAGLSAAVLFVLLAHAKSGLSLAPLFVLGLSDLLTVSFIALAIESHLAGRRRAALWSMSAAALVRPEAGLLLAGYSALLWRRHPEHRTGGVSAVVLVAVLWIVPDYLGSGELFRASKLARGQIPRELRRPHPGVAVLGYLPTGLVLPTKLGVLLAGLVALRTRDRVLGALLGLFVAWTLVIAVMAESGYPGLERFLATPMALAALLGGCGAALAIRSVRLRLVRSVLLTGWTTAIALLAPAAVHALSLQLDGAAAQARSNNRLAIALDRAALKESLRSCRVVATGPLAIPMAHWYLPEARPTSFTRHAGLILVAAHEGRRPVPTLSPRRTRRYLLIATATPWKVLYRCRGATRG